MKVIKPGLYKNKHLLVRRLYRSIANLEKEIHEKQHEFLDNELFFILKATQSDYEDYVIHECLSPVHGHFFMITGGTFFFDATEPLL